MKEQNKKFVRKNINFLSVLNIFNKEYDPNYDNKNKKINSKWNLNII